MDFEVVKKEHLLEAIRVIARDGVPSGRHSVAYDVVHDGDRYPPKWVFATAYELATGQSLHHTAFEGGARTPAFKVMKAEGLTIRKKKEGQPARRVWSIAAGLGSAQWPAWQECGEISLSFSDHPRDIREFDSHQAVLDWLSSRVTDSRPTNDALALWEFCREVQVGDWVLVKSGHHDWLGFGEVSSDYRFDVDRDDHQHRREVVWIKTGKWTRPTRPPLKTLTEITRYSSKQNNDNDYGWQDHLELIYGGTIPKYWLWQGNPKHYNFKAALEQKSLDYLSVRQHKEKMQDGDQAILWITGKGNGASAVMTLKGEPSERNDAGEFWIQGGDRREFKVQVDISHYTHREPLDQSVCEQELLLAPLFPRQQGTNFEISPGQFELMKQMAIGTRIPRSQEEITALSRELDRFFEQLHQGGLGSSHYAKSIGQAELQVSFGTGRAAVVPWMALTRPGVDIKEGIYPVLLYFRRLERLILAYGISETNKPGLVWPAHLLDMAPSIGQAYPKAFRYKKSFICQDYDQLSRGPEFSFARKGSTDPLTSEDLARDFLDLLQQYWNLESTTFVAQEPAESYTSTDPNTLPPMATNTILYGPPGTGKTWTFNNKFRERYESREVASRAQVLEKVARQMTWRDVAAVVLLEQGPSTLLDIMEHELMKAKGAMSSSKDPKATVSTALLEHISEECTATNIKSRRAPFYFWLEKSSGKSVYSVDRASQEEVVLAVEEFQNELNEARSDTEISIRKRWKFVTFHQSFSYEDFVEGIKPVMGEEESGLDYQIEEGVFKSICREAGRDQKNRYCIFIDEINRGNVASIFGELITLIEPDKRLGQNQALTVTLPYSKEEFGVPSNLDIIGTMNTADRSVEALDTALRRRFTFVEVGPNPSLLRGSEVAGVDLEALLATLNARLEHLLDRDHCLGHSHFWKIKDQGLLDDLRKVFAQGVLPQMQEYFYGDMGKIGLVLGSAFVEPKPRQEVKFAAFDHEDRELLQDKEVYRLIDPMTLPAEAFKAIYD